MRRLYAFADIYIKESTWKDLALIKSCLCAIGVLIGLVIPRAKKKWSIMTAAAIFIVTYIPLMAKFLEIMFRKREQGEKLEENKRKNKQNV